MEFIREKIKEKPISKRKVFTILGVAALCGLVFSMVVFVMILIFKPAIQEAILPQPPVSEADTSSAVDTESTEDV